MSRSNSRLATRETPPARGAGPFDSESYGSGVAPESSPNAIDQSESPRGRGRWMRADSVPRPGGRWPAALCRLVPSSHPPRRKRTVSEPLSEPSPLPSQPEPFPSPSPSRCHRRSRTARAPNRAGAHPHRPPPGGRDPVPPAGRDRTVLRQRGRAALSTTRTTRRPNAAGTMASPRGALAGRACARSARGGLRVKAAAWAGRREGGTG
jgi:hypothetical protein